MKDDGVAGREVLAFSRDNPPEMKRKGLVDFARYERIKGEKLATKEQHGEVPTSTVKMSWGFLRRGDAAVLAGTLR